MTRPIHKLSDAKVKSDRLAKGRHSDGGGLYLNVSPLGTKSWVFMWSRKGRRREMGLGAYPAVTLAAARKMAERNRATVANGGDPIAEKTMEAVPDFGKCADDYIASMEATWRNEKHRAQWKMTLKEYCVQFVQSRFPK